MKALCLVLSMLMLVSFTCQAKDSLNNKEKLGEVLFQDKNLSLNKNQACASCHSLQPANSKSFSSGSVTGFVDPDNVNEGTAVSAGSIPNAKGSLNTPSVGYAAFSPLFHWDKEKGLYIGGHFWNGRAKDLDEQAQKPLLNPLEMAMPSEWAVVERIKQDKRYKELFWEAYGINLDSSRINTVFNLAAKAISEYERTAVFNKFTSKYDYVLAGKTTLTAIEEKGLTLFNGKGNCAACHTSEVTRNKNGEILLPLFTDFTYDNVGLPRNVKIPNNPEPDLGLGGRSDIAALDPEGNEIGKHKVMSLRNVALTPPYGHNGVLDTLEQVVHFYNTRDTLGLAFDNKDPKFGKSGWPEPEVAQNVNHDELGNLELSNEEEMAIVAFLQTLTDDYQIWGGDKCVPPWSPAPFEISPSSILNRAANSLCPSNQTNTE
ncbi:MAG: cytochrome c peroxidase [Candidatus Nitrotoga sp.]